MTTVDAEELAGWRDRTVIGPDGEKVGKVFDIYADEQTGQPEWLAVKTGLTGKSVSFVPLVGADPRGDEIVVAYDKARVKDAPSADPDGRSASTRKPLSTPTTGSSTRRVGPGVVFPSDRVVSWRRQ